MPKTLSRVPAFVPEALLLFAVVFAPLAFGAVEPWSRAVLEADLLLLAAACALRGGANYSQPVYRALLPAVVFVLGLAGLQLLNPRAAAGPAGLLPFTASAPETGGALLLWACYAALLWSAPQVLASCEARKRFLRTFFAVGTIVAVVGLLQRGQGNSAYYGLRPVRQGAPFGPFVNRDHAASFLAMSAAIGGGLFLARARRRSGGDSFGEKSDFAAAQIMILFALALTLAGLKAAGSRGAGDSFVLALWGVAALATGFVPRPGPRWAARAAVGAAAVAGALFAAARPSYVGWAQGAPDASTGYRLSMYRSGAAMLGDFPLWGVGLGAARAVFPAYQERMVVGLIEHVHSDWLEFPLEIGLVGGAVLAAGLAAFFIQILRAWSREASRGRRLLSGAALAAVVSLLIHEAVDFSFQVPGDAAVFLCLLSYLSAMAVPAPLGASRRERG